jgi:hypothetical protein
MRPYNQSYISYQSLRLPLKRANLSETGKKQQELGVSRKKTERIRQQPVKHMFKMQQIHKLFYNNSLIIKLNCEIILSLIFQL